MEGRLLERKGADKEVPPGEDDRSRGRVALRRQGGQAKPGTNRKRDMPSELPRFHTSPPPTAPSPCPGPASRPPAPFQPLLPADSSLFPTTTNPLPQATRAGRRIPSCKLLSTQRRAF